MGKSIKVYALTIEGDQASDESIAAAMSLMITAPAMHKTLLEAQRVLQDYIDDDVMGERLGLAQYTAMARVLQRIDTLLGKAPREQARDGS